MESLGMGIKLAPTFIFSSKMCACWGMEPSWASITMEMQSSFHWIYVNQLYGDGTGQSDIQAVHYGG